MLCGLTCGAWFWQNHTHSRIIRHKAVKVCFKCLEAHTPSRLPGLHRGMVRQLRVTPLEGVGVSAHPVRR
eukprot:1804776-Amphidinium_carterae.1